MGAASIRVPSVLDLDEDARRAVEAFGRGMARAGCRVWLVGGAVRDLALGESPKDVDLASAATPDEVEAVHEQAVAVGRAFGTLIVPIGGVDLQHTTFRTESSYSDARRPDRVEFGRTLEEDAQRRDFTCNALYLDPLSDELRDPTGGLDDLRAGRLRCVGDARERFAEDGLRLMRLARFAAAFQLAVDDDLLAAARDRSESIVGVSSERVLHELERSFARAGAARAVELLEATGVLRRLFPGVADGLPARFAHLAGAAGSELGLALLLWPADGAEDAHGLAARRLEGLRPSRDLRRAVDALWRAAAEAVTILGRGGPAAVPRPRWIRLVRRPDWDRTVALLRGLGRGGPALDGLVAAGAALAAEDRDPEPLVRSEDLRRAGVVPGPRFGELLARAEDAQLAGELRRPEDVPGWLRRQLGDASGDGPEGGSG